MTLLVNLAQRYSIPLSVALLAVLIALVPQVKEAFVYDRTLIDNGEFWRLISANLLHTNWIHLLLNLGGMGLIWLIFWDVTDAKWQLTFLLLPVILNTLFLYYFSPDMQRYVGLSGALHGTIIAFGLADFSNNKLTSIGLLVGVTIKLGWEQIYGSSESVEQLISATVAVDAHLWGAVAGLITGFIYLLSNDTKIKKA